MAVLALMGALPLKTLSRDEQPCQSSSFRLVHTTKAGKDSCFGSFGDKLLMLPPTGLVAADVDFRLRSRRKVCVRTFGRTLYRHLPSCGHASYFLCGALSLQSGEP